MPQSKLSELIKEYGDKPFDEIMDELMKQPPIEKTGEDDTRLSDMMKHYHPPSPVPSETKQGEKEEKTAKDASEEINKLIETEWELYVGLPSSNKLKALLFSFAQKVSRIIEKNLSNYLATPSPVSHQGTILHGKEGEIKSEVRDFWFDIFNERYPDEVAEIMKQFDRPSDKDLLAKDEDF